MNFLNNKLRESVVLSLVAATTLVMFGCGGEGSAENGTDGTDGNSNTASVTLSAQDAFYSTGYAESFEVDLSSNVLSSTGNGFILSGVDVLSTNDNCQIKSLTEFGFIIEALDTKACDYRYYVTPQVDSSVGYDSQAPMAMSDGIVEEVSSAVTRIAVSSDPSSTELIPVSATTLINEEISVDLKYELDKVGFTLGEQFVLTELTLPYGRASSAAINDVDDQVIDYTPPPGFSGIDRVLYTLEDSENGLVLMGVLDVAVGYELNQGFTIDDNLEYPEVIEIFVEEEIDISSFVSSDDGDDFQLVYVETYNAEAEPKDPTDPSNKIIIFQSSQAGYHYITFAVSDHNGAYDIGILRVAVVDPDQYSKWDDVNHLSDLYMAPLTSLEATTGGIVYDVKLTDSAYSPEIEMAGFRYPSAFSYCEAAGASIPSLEELTQMTEDIDLQLYHNWPVQAKYLAYDEVTDSYLWVDLTDNVVSNGDVDSTSAYYVTCIKQGTIYVLPESSSQAVADGVDIAYVRVELIRDQVSKPGVVVSASVSSPDVALESDSVTTDNDGIAEFRLTSFKAESVTLTLDVNGAKEEYEVLFISDEKAAAVSSEATIDEVEYNSVEGGQVTATLTDQNGNLVAGYSVTSTVSSEVHPETGELVTPILEAETPQTDESGEQKVRVKWDTNDQTPILDMTFDVTSSYTTTTNTQTDAISQVTFTNNDDYLCGSQVGDDDLQNAIITCVKIVEHDDKLYTGTPSVDFLNSVGFSDYDGIYKETADDGPLGEFAIFNQLGAGSLCSHYNTLELYGRDNWTLASFEELQSLYYNFGNMYESKGWAATQGYWSSTQYGYGSEYYYMRLNNGGSGHSWLTDLTYASCVSDS